MAGAQRCGSMFLSFLVLVSIWWQWAILCYGVQQWCHLQVVQSVYFLGYVGDCVAVTQGMVFRGCRLFYWVVHTGYV